ncbi:MAG: ABC transporter ATP-binding protein [Candidatus Magasanikbacteria bacterium]|nr:ABC transporter ATP-binding protein [Candidatus Magasanikbacteria bacterium]
MASIIEVSNLSKKYYIGESERYLALRDTLANIIKSPFGWTKGKIFSDKNEFLALQDLNFTVEKGEVLGVIGRNGAGKSTLLKILSRITPPTTGEIKLRGRVGSLLEVGTGFHPELTGRENIYLNGAILGMRKAEIKKKISEIIEFSGVEKFIDTPVKRYSSGMYVRLAFSVAAHLEPDILIVDEVLAVGDIEFQKKCIGKMEEVTRKDGRTVLFVSHNMAMMQKLCDNCILLEGGKIIQSGPVDKVVNFYLSQMNNSMSAPANEFPDDPKFKIQLRSIKLLNVEGKNIRDYNCDEPITIEMVCRSNGPLLGMYGLLNIKKPDGTTVMESDSRDVLPNQFENLSAGLHTIRLVIPPRTIGVGEYVVFVEFVHDSSPKYEIDVPGLVCSFSMDDSSTMRGNFRCGYISTLLEWKTK